jgi:tetratricopeptide (TPR) repeat protein
MNFLTRAAGVTFLGSLLLALPGDALAAKFRAGLKNGLSCITISGVITPNDSRGFIAMANRSRNAGQPARLVLLNSTGGNLYEAYQIAKYIDQNRMDTLVEGSKICGSACFLIFISGRNRHADPGSGMFVHRVNEYNRDTDQARSATIDLNNAYRHYGVPDKIRLAMMDTPPNQAYQLTPADIRQLNRGHVPSSHGTASARRPQAQQQPPVRPRPQAQTQAQPRQQARRQDPPAGTCGPAERGWGIQLVRGGNYQQAVETLKPCTKTMARDPDVFFNLGYAYAALGDWEKARKALERTVKLSPGKGIAWGNLAEVLAAQGEIEEAADCYVSYWQHIRDKDAATRKLFRIVKENRNTPKAKAAAIAIDTLDL